LTLELTDSIISQRDVSPTPFDLFRRNCTSLTQASSIFLPFQSVIEIATAAVGLAGAVISRDPGAIAKCVAAVYAEVKGPVT
jgi:hypothetical protein